jgi:hypothetical protein
MNTANANVSLGLRSELDPTVQRSGPLAATVEP